MGRKALFVLFLAVLSCEDRSSPPAITDTVHSRQIRFDKRSEYHRVLVIDESEMRYLRFGSQHGGNQGVISLSEPSAVPMAYIRFAMLGMLLTSQPERMLMIGLGAGTFTTLLRRHYPALWMDAVEIDQVVVQAAKAFFRVREDSRFRIHVEDGATFIEQTQHSYDLVMLDAYTGESIPEHLAGLEFFNAVKAKLSPGGVAVLNVWDEAEREPLIETHFRSTFPVTACIRSRDGFNLVLFGKALGKIPAHSDLVTAARELTSDFGLSFDLGKVAERLRAECPGP